MASGNIDEMFTEYAPQVGEVLLQEENQITWTRIIHGDGWLREIKFPVRVVHQGTGSEVIVGNVYLGIDEHVLQGQISDPRIATSLIIIAVFIIGILMIVALVSVFVKPIQVLTDGCACNRPGL